MSWYGGYGYYAQPTKAELLRKANASMRALEKKGRTLNPVRIEGRTIGRTWWGKAWVQNIKRYADFSNRVDRGAKYVRAGCVIDLAVEVGHVSATVQGSRKNPYEVDVHIAPMGQDAFAELVEGCSERADNLESLLAGNFPEQMKERLTAQGGLFPAPSEISFDCNCPDWASMCKHVAAAIMAVAPQLDADPLTLFTLRGVDTSELLQRTVEQKLGLMLEHADDPSPRVLDLGDEELTRLFGVL